MVSLGKKDGKEEIAELLWVQRSQGEKRSKVWVKPWQPQELTLALAMVMMRTQTCDKHYSAHTLKSK